MMKPLVRTSYSTLSNESTPLVSPRTVGARNTLSQKKAYSPSLVLKQRNNNSKNEQQQQDQQDQQQSSSYGCGGDGDEGKEDRRSMFGRFISSIKQSIPFISLSSSSTSLHNRINNNESEETTKEENDQKYYEDPHNDDSWSCSFGTKEEDGTWINLRDRVGTIMSSMVWVLIIYSGFTVCLLVQYNNLSQFLALVYITLCGLALSAHIKTTLTDPGSIPRNAVPIDVYGSESHTMCSRCQSYKPPMAHHCRICDRCISRMDHHCPWMNNCVGAGNMKHFILFLVYIWTLCALSLIVFGFNYFFCTSEECIFNIVIVQLVRAMTLIAIATIFFTSSMLTNVTFGIITGIGTIDRLKKKADGTWNESDERPLELKEIFGIGHVATWCIPTDPVFEDYDAVMGYSTPQRLLREQQQQHNTTVYK